MTEPASTGTAIEVTGGRPGARSNWRSWARWLLVVALLAAGWRVQPRFQAARGLELEPSVERLEAAVRQVPDDPGHHFRLGVVYRDLPEVMDLERSRRHLERAIALHPLNWRYRRELAQLHELAGRRTEAERSYLEALRLNPGSADYRWRLAHFYLRDGSADQALPHLRAALEAQPHLRPSALDFLLRARLSLEQIEAAWPASAAAREELTRLLCESPPSTVQPAGHALAERCAAPASVTAGVPER